MHHGVIHDDGVLLQLLERKEVGHLDVTSKADDFVADGVFKSQYHAYRHNHDGQSDGYASCGNMYGRARNLSFVALLVV